MKLKNHNCECPEVIEETEIKSRNVDSKSRKSISMSIRSSKVVNKIRRYSSKKKVHSGHPGKNCSCSSCTYRICSVEPSVKDLLAEGSKIDQLYLGKYIPLREQKLLNKLIRTRAVYDDVRDRIINTNNTKDNRSCCRDPEEFKKLKSRSKRKKKNDYDDSEENPSNDLDEDSVSSAVLELVHLVDKGDIDQASLSTCCSCCTCDSKLELEHADIEHRRGRSLSSSRSSIASSLTKHREEHHNKAHDTKYTSSKEAEVIDETAKAIKANCACESISSEDENIISAGNEYEQKHYETVDMTTQSANLTRRTKTQKVGSNLMNKKKSKTVPTMTENPEDLPQNTDSKKYEGSKRHKKPRLIHLTSIRQQKRAWQSYEESNEINDRRRKMKDATFSTDKLAKKQVATKMDRDRKNMREINLLSTTASATDKQKTTKTERQRKRIRKNNALSTSATDKQETDETTMHVDIKSKINTSSNTNFTKGNQITDNVATNINTNKKGKRNKNALNATSSVDNNEVTNSTNADRQKKKHKRNIYTLSTTASSTDKQVMNEAATKTDMNRERLSEINALRSTESTFDKLATNKGAAKDKRFRKTKSKKIGSEELEKGPKVVLDKNQAENERNKQSKRVPSLLDYPQSLQKYRLTKEGHRLKRCFCTIKIKPKTISSKIGQTIHTKELYKNRKYMSKRSNSTPGMVTRKNRSVGSSSSKTRLENVVFSKKTHNESQNPHNLHRIETFKIEKRPTSKFVKKHNKLIPLSVSKKSIIRTTKPITTSTKSRTTEPVNSPKVISTSAKPVANIAKSVTSHTVVQTTNKPSQIKCLCPTGKSENNLEYHKQKQSLKIKKSRRKMSSQTIHKEPSGGSPLVEPTPRGVNESTYTKDKNRTKRLRSYECEPGICVQHNFDPHICLKIINARNRKNIKRIGTKSRQYSSTSSMAAILNSKTKSVQSALMTQKEQATQQQRAVGRDNNNSNKIPMIYYSSPQRQAVRVGSTVSFSVEFYKETAPTTNYNALQDTPQVNKQINESSESKNHKPSLKAIGSQGPTPGFKNMSTLKNENRKEKWINSALKRCFCALKLHRGAHKKSFATDTLPPNDSKHFKSQMISKETITSTKRKQIVKAFDTELVSRGTQKHKKQKKYQLQPYECEPFYCTPGECDPYKCLERIKIRGKTKSKHFGVNTDKNKVRSRSNFINRSTESKNEQIQSNQLLKRTRSTTYKGEKTKHSKRKIEAAQGKSSRQAVRVGSTFSFHVDFYKDKNYSEPTDTRIRSPKKYYNILRKDAAGSPIKSSASYTDSGESPHKRRKKRKCLQVGSKYCDEMSETEQKLKRCFCTLKLQKKQGHKKSNNQINNRLKGTTIMPALTVCKKTKLVKSINYANSLCASSSQMYSEISNNFIINDQSTVAEMVNDLLITGLCDPVECDLLMKSVHKKRLKKESKLIENSPRFILNQNIASSTVHTQDKQNISTKTYNPDSKPITTSYQGSSNILNGKRSDSNKKPHFTDKTMPEFDIKTTNRNTLNVKHRNAKAQSGEPSQLNMPQSFFKRCLCTLLRNDNKTSKYSHSGEIPSPSGSFIKKFLCKLRSSKNGNSVPKAAKDVKAASKHNDEKAKQHQAINGLHTNKRNTIFGNTNKWQTEYIIPRKLDQHKLNVPIMNKNTSNRNNHITVAKNKVAPGIIENKNMSIPRELYDKEKENYASGSPYIIDKLTRNKSMQREQRVRLKNKVFNHTVSKSYILEDLKRKSVTRIKHCKLMTQNPDELKLFPKVKSEFSKSLNTNKKDKNAKGSIYYSMLNPDTPLQVKHDFLPIHYVSGQDARHEFVKKIKVKNPKISKTLKSVSTRQISKCSKSSIGFLAPDQCILKTSEHPVYSYGYPKYQQSEGCFKYQQDDSIAPDDRCAHYYDAYHKGNHLHSQYGYIREDYCTQHPYLLTNLNNVSENIVPTINGISKEYFSENLRSKIKNNNFERQVIVGRVDNIATASPFNLNPIEPCRCSKNKKGNKKKLHNELSQVSITTKSQDTQCREPMLTKYKNIRTKSIRTPTKILGSMKRRISKDEPLTAIKISSDNLQTTDKKGTKKEKSLKKSHVKRSDGKLQTSKLNSLKPAPSKSLAVPHIATIVKDHKKVVTKEKGLKKSQIKEPLSQNLQPSMKKDAEFQVSKLDNKRCVTTVRISGDNLKFCSAQQLENLCRILPDPGNIAMKLNTQKQTQDSSDIKDSHASPVKSSHKSQKFEFKGAVQTFKTQPVTLIKELVKWSTGSNTSCECPEAISSKRIKSQAEKLPVTGKGPCICCKCQSCKEFATTQTNKLKVKNKGTIQMHKSHHVQTSTPKKTVTFGLPLGKEQAIKKKITPDNIKQEEMNNDIATTVKVSGDNLMYCFTTSKAIVNSPFNEKLVQSRGSNKKRIEQAIKKKITPDNIKQEEMNNDIATTVKVSGDNLMYCFTTSKAIVNSPFNEKLVQSRGSNKKRIGQVHDLKNDCDLYTALHNTSKSKKNKDTSNARGDTTVKIGGKGMVTRPQAAGDYKLKKKGCGDQDDSCCKCALNNKKKKIRHVETLKKPVVEKTKSFPLRLKDPGEASSCCKCKECSQKTEANSVSQLKKSNIKGGSLLKKSGVKNTDSKKSSNNTCACSSKKSNHTCTCKMSRRQREKFLLEVNKSGSLFTDILKKIKERQRRVKPCVCGIKICDKEKKRLRLGIKEQPAQHPCICGSKVCKELLKKQQDKAKKKAIKNKKLQKKRISGMASRRKEYARIDEKIRKEREKRHLTTLGHISRYKNASNCALASESLLDVGKLGLTAAYDATRMGFRRLKDPLNTIYLAEQVIHSPKQTCRRCKELISDIGVLNTAKQIRKRTCLMKCSRSIKDTFRNFALTNFLMHMFESDPKKRLKFKKKVVAKHREPMNFNCSLYMGSLRKRPCLWVYYRYPWFYPHCISLLRAWTQFTDVILFMLALLVWSPCILGMELLRSLMCCFVCTG